MSLLRLKTTERRCILVAFLNRAAVQENEPLIHCCLLNSCSRWIVRLRHRNFTVKIYEVVRLLSMQRQQSSGVMRLGFYLKVIHSHAFIIKKKFINAKMY